MSRDAPTVEVLTAPDAEDRQRRAAGALVAGGCRPGDRVVFCLPSSADLICAVLGAARLGIIPVLLNATLTEPERDRLILDARPAITVLTTADLSRLMEGGPTELAPYPLTRPMHYTSGTTGQPKGVTTGLWDEATAQAVFEDEAAVWQFDPADLHMVCSPLYHTVAVRFSAGTLLSGGSLVILSRFDATTALQVLRQVRPTTAFLVPTHLQRILQSAALGPDESFDSLRLLAHAGAPCPPAVKRATMARVRAGAVWEFYGSTEAQFTVCGPDEWLQHPGTVGRARPGRRLFVEPVDDGGDGGVGSEGVAGPDGSGPGPVGTIWCDMPAFARFSYWGDDAATARSWRGPACTVGDLGSVDGEGYLYLSGRRQDLIISGGVNVYPAEVEAVLAAVPGVVQLAVFGWADEQWGQRVCVAYVSDRAGTEDALRTVAAAQLAPYKRPKSYFAVPELPHTTTGKVLRRAIPEQVGLTAPKDPGPR
jgi:long-chain acyl-CoA synthetase